MVEWWREEEGGSLLALRLVAASSKGIGTKHTNSRSSHLVRRSSHTPITHLNRCRTVRIHQRRGSLFTKPEPRYTLLPLPTSSNDPRALRAHATCGKAKIERGLDPPKQSSPHALSLLNYCGEKHHLISTRFASCMGKDLPLAFRSSETSN